MIGGSIGFSCDFPPYLWRYVSVFGLISFYSTLDFFGVSYTPIYIVKKVGVEF